VANTPVSAHNHDKIVAPAVFIHPETLVLVSTVTNPKTPITTKSATPTTTTTRMADVKPFVINTVVDRIPHFRLIFPHKKIPIATLASIRVLKILQRKKKE